MPIRIGQHPDHGFDEPLGLLSDCHRRIEHFLQVLIAVAERSGATILSSRDRADLESALNYFSTAAPRHTADEEASLFPRLRESHDPDVARTLEHLAHLESDHRRADEHHRQVELIVRQWLEAGTANHDAVRALTAHLEALRAIYSPHIELEDRELFPAAHRMLSADQLRDIGHEMKSRRTPAIK